jgi:hypothetical protein
MKLYTLIVLLKIFLIHIIMLLDFFVTLISNLEEKQWLVNTLVKFILLLSNIKVLHQEIKNKNQLQKLITQNIMFKI